MFAAVQRETAAAPMRNAKASTDADVVEVHKNATDEKYFIRLAMLLRCDTSALLVMVERRGP